jgi:ABC-2 type transport system permease protein
MADGDLIDRAERADSLQQTLAALFRYRELLKNLVLKDLKLKYRGSILGFFWSLLNPLLMIGVYTVAFRYILRSTIEGFVFYLMIGILAWTFFVNSLMMATNAIVDSGGLVKSIFFPRAILPVATVLFNFAQYTLTVVVLMPLMMAFSHAPISPALAAYPLFLALQLLFTAGLGLMVATWTVFFRDIRHFLEVLLGAMFWVTPIVYQSAQAPARLRPILRLTPMTPFITAYHDIFYYGRWPELSVWLLAAAYAGVASAAGLTLMLTREDRFSEAL